VPGQSSGSNIHNGMEIAPDVNNESTEKEGLLESKNNQKINGQVRILFKLNKERIILIKLSFGSALRRQTKIERKHASFFWLIVSKRRRSAYKQIS
jgi:hypothetical protein